MNKVILIGNLTKDPEISTTSNGVSVCRFSLAVTRRYTNANGEREADFVNIVVWRALADNCHKFLKKGSKAAVVGSLQSRAYDATDGTKRYVTEVVAEEVEFISTRNSDVVETRKDEEEVTKLEPIDDNDLPF
jgi:single-strand DNA-binding protein